MCAIQDIPVYEGSSSNAIVQSLHCLFTLYSEFKENQHFNGAVPDFVVPSGGDDDGDMKESETFTVRNEEPTYVSEGKASHK